MKLASPLALSLMAARFGFRAGCGEFLTMVGRLLLITVIVIAYGGVFNSIDPSALRRVGLDVPKMVWYLLSTEFVLFCATAPFKEFLFEIQAGYLFSALVRPCAIWHLKLSEWIGQAFANLLFLSLPCLLLGGVVSGDFSYAPRFLLTAIVSVPLGCFIFLCGNFIIGASCLWTKQPEGFFLIFQKLLFLLGALIWPLTIYPFVWQIGAWMTPFPAMLATVGLGVIDSGAVFFLALIHQLISVGVAVVCVIFMERAVRARIQAGGE